MDTNLTELVVRSLPARVWHGVAEWVSTAFGQMATGEFWVKLLETIVKQMVNAFMITLGGKLLTYGVNREDPEVKKTANIYGTQSQPVSAATAAFNNGSVRPDYVSQFQRATDYRSYSQTPLEKSFPGFGGTNR